MRALVTGHKGFTGSVIVPALVRDGIDVDGMDTDLYRECTFAGSLASVPEIEGGIRDVVPTDLEGFDAVIHLAALSNDPLGDINPELTYDINHRATTHFAQPARDAGVERFLFRRRAATTEPAVTTCWPRPRRQIKQLMESGRLGPDPRWT